MKRAGTAPPLPGCLIKHWIYLHVPGYHTAWEHNHARAHKKIARGPTARSPVATSATLDGTKGPRRGITGGVYGLAPDAKLFADQAFRLISGTVKGGAIEQAAKRAKN